MGYRRNERQTGVARLKNYEKLRKRKKTKLNKAHPGYISTYRNRGARMRYTDFSKLEYG